MVGTTKVFLRTLDTKFLKDFNRTITVTVENVNDFKEAQRASVDSNGKATEYIILNHKLGKDENIILLHSNYTILQVYKTALKRTHQSVSGYTLELIPTASTHSTDLYVQTFLNTQTAFIVDRHEAVAAGKAAILQVLNGTSASSWEVKFGSSKFSSLDMTFTVGGSEYKVTVTEEYKFNSTYGVEVVDKDNKLHSSSVVLIRSVSKDLSFDSVVLVDNEIVNKYVITVDFKDNKYSMSHTALETIDKQLNDAVFKFRTHEGTEIVEEESSAAVAGLMKWIVGDYKQGLQITRLSASA